MVIFLTLAVFIFGSVHYYFFRRLIKDTGLIGRERTIAKWVIVFLGVITFASFPLSRLLPLPINRAVMLIPYIWMGLMVFLLASLGLVDLVRFVIAAFRKVMGRNRLEVAALQSFYRIAQAFSLGATLLAGALSLWGGLSSPEVKEIRVSLDRLDSSFDGMKIVQVTDLHIGPTLGRDWLEDVVGRVNQLEPDVIVITGDLVDGPVERLSSEVAPLARLKARLGVYFVTGNHEYFSGVEEWIKKIGDLGIKVLSDEIVPIGGDDSPLLLAGVSDFRGGHGDSDDGRDLTEILAGFEIAEGQEAILLLHNPRNILGVEDDRIGLVLTGHTHGGQFWPFSLLVGLGHPYLSGMYSHKGRTKVYVSEGTGFWGPPMRLGTTGEITQITLSQ